ncbi:MAG: DUF2169 domain-containing protein [Polyangiaceae bacterium]|nr:DUF2169 domain-containing protein [Polyangiaceae bacterium]
MVVRRRERVHVVHRTALTAWTMPWRIADGDVLVIAAKASFDLVAGEAARLRPESDPPSGDVHAGDSPASSLLYPTDFAVTKPRVDVVLRGTAHAPGGSATAARVSFAFGRRGTGFVRHLAVFGEREWTGLARTMSAPRRFERISLGWERAFGGPGHGANPVGTGLARGADGRWRLPNLEDPERLVAGPGDRPPPAGLGAVPMLWPARWGKLGTYGRDWLETRWPHFPTDFDWTFFQAAPAEQQLAEVQGDEPYELAGLHAAQAVFAGKLGGVRARCFAQRTGEAGGQFTALALRLDTVVFDTDAGTCHCVWRTVLPVSSPRAPELAALFVATEPVAGPALELAAAERLFREQSADVPELGPLLASPPSPPSRAAAGATPPATEPDETPTTSAATRALHERLAAAGVPEAWLGVAAPTAAAAHPALPDAAAIRAALLANRDREAAIWLGALLLRVERAARLRALVLGCRERGESLAGRDLEGADLAGLDLRGADLAGANLRGADLRHAVLTGASLVEASLGGADASFAALDEARLDGADLGALRLEGASLRKASLVGAVLAGAGCAGADFSEAHADRALFTGADLRRARFEHAELRAADCSGATLDEARFDHARAAGLRLYDARGSRVSFASAELDGARADGVHLERASLGLCRAPGSVWDDAELDGCDFQGAALGGASFERASGRGLVLRRADLKGARLRGASLEQAMLGGADAMEASFEAASLRGADLRGASLYGAELLGADLGGARLELADTTRTRLEARR